MDDKRFDSITRALASGASRRSVLKGLLGLGAAAATSTVVNDATEAARRPTPTPKPVTCPGNQTWNGTKCECPDGLSQCVPNTGPACCNDQNVDPGEPGYSTCCDNACCQGTCYNEELCCATNARPGEQPPTNRICQSVSGTECCPYSDDCCTIDGCCATTCFGGSDGVSYCCPAGDSCPGGSESADLCCEGDTVCCGPNTNGNVCTDLSDDDDNCGACGNVCQGCSSCQQGVCLPDDANCEGTLICCPDDNTFTCEVGPNCGCDNDDDCNYLDNASTCTAGHCQVVSSLVSGTGTCVAVPAANTVVCHPAGSGANATCDPAVYCSGQLQECPGADYAPEGTDCGACMACNATGVCTAQCGVEEDCCPDTDLCVPDGAICCTSSTQCTVPCQICNEEAGYCVTTCTAGQSCCTLGDGGAKCCSTEPGFACCEGDGCVDTQTDDNNCGECGHVCPGCSTCQAGLCTATNSRCDVQGEICCKDGDTYTCEQGPYCGCDGPADCDPCYNCNLGICELSCEDDEHCCPALGTHGICVSDDVGIGCCISGDCTNTGEDDCLVGTCSATGVCSYAPDNDLCIDENPCTDAICSAEGVCSFPTDCSNDPVVCCPGCLDCSGTTCVENDANCTDTGTDACLVGACNADGTCTYTPNNALCDEGTPCQDGTCNADGSCTYTGDCSNDPEVCCPGCLDCSGSTCVQNNANCTATGPDGCLVGECNANGTCSYAPNNALCADTNPCTDGVCSAEGVCSFPTDCSNDPGFCCPGCLDCGQTGACVENNNNCITPPNTLCYVSPGDCTGTGTCTYTPQPSGFDCGICRTCDGVGACLIVPNNTDPGDDCVDGSTCCGGVCTALGTNINCASCGDICPTGQTCVGGVCTPVCPSPPPTDCDDVADGCPCNANGFPGVCSGGDCEFACPNGSSDCSPNPIDTNAQCCRLVGGVYSCKTGEGSCVCFDNGDCGPGGTPPRPGNCCGTDGFCTQSCPEQGFAPTSVETEECFPANCDALGCGQHPDDGCGNALDCGECCKPKDICLDTDCGTVDDGCGGTIECNPCCVPADCTTIDTCGLGLDAGCGVLIDCPCPEEPIVEEPVTCVADGVKCDPDADVCCGIDMVCREQNRRGQFKCRPIE